MYIFWHTIMIRAVNSWLWYRRHCKLLQEGKTMSLYTFISYIASGLVEVSNKTSPAVKRPIDDVRTDGDSHLPDWTEKRQRCKMRNCDKFSYIASLFEQRPQLFCRLSLTFRLCTFV